jgi:ParB/RepB/Spo0J family partition protein
MKRPVSDIPATNVPLNWIVVEEKGKGKIKRSEVEELAEDIRNCGLTYPVVLAGDLVEEKKLRIKAGRRRIAAVSLLGWKEIRAIVIPTEEPSMEARWVELIESIQQNNLTDYDIAETACEMEEKCEVRGNVFARRLGISPGYTYNLMRWFRSIPDEIRDAWKKQHHLLTQVELERFSHMKRAEVMAAWRKRLDLKTPEGHKNGRNPRRASEHQILQLQEAIDRSGLRKPVRELCTNIIRFVLGTTKDVPGITKGRPSSELVTKRSVDASSSPKAA